MKILFRKEELNSAMVPLMCAVSSKNVMPATAGVLMKTIGNDAVELCSYDLEKGVRTSVPAQVIEEGCYVINAVKLNQILKTLTEEELIIEVDDNCSANITSGRSEFSMPALPERDFPSLPELTGEANFSFPQKVLKNMIGKTLFAVATTDQRPIYCGVYFEIKSGKIIAVSCDSFRLAYTEQIGEIKDVDKNSDVDETFIIPGKTLMELMKFLSDDIDDEVMIRLGRKHVTFEIGNLVFFSRLLEGQYLAYNKYIPTDSTIFVKIDKTSFISSLEKAALISEEKAQIKNFVKCSFKGDLLCVSANAVSGKVYDEVPIEKTGDDLEIAFTCRYLLEALRVCDSDTLKLSMSGPLRAMVIEPAADADKGSFLFVTLPTRMKA